MRTLLFSMIGIGAIILQSVACGGQGPSTAATASAGGSGPGGSGSGGTGTTSTSATGGAAPVCTPPLEPVAPSGTSDVTYTNQPDLGCLGEPCLCSTSVRGFVDHVLACDPIAGGYYVGQGSMALRVIGRAAGACVIDVGVEIEGGVTYSRCTLPLPVTPWQGLGESDPVQFPTVFLDGIADRCQTVGQCSILVGFPSPCGTSLPAAPLCQSFAACQ